MSDKVIGVRFKKAGKIYYFNPLSIPFEAGEGVIVETSRGIEFGEVVIGAREIEQKELQKPLRPVIRRADEEDYARIEANQRKEKEAFAVCEKIAGTIDEEVKRIIDECYNRARGLLQEYHSVLDACAKLLLEKEKISRKEFEALFDKSSAENMDVLDMDGIHSDVYPAGI